MSAETLARLAASLSEADGTYAVLLGSGISSAAGISTGWEIAIDRIPKMAIAAGEVLQTILRHGTRKSLVAR